MELETLLRGEAWEYWTGEEEIGPIRTSGIGDRLQDSSKTFPLVSILGMGSPIAPLQVKMHFSMMGKFINLKKLCFISLQKGYLQPWTFTSSDNRFNVTFEPAVDRSSTTNFLVIKSAQHQVFGYFSGSIILDDGRNIPLNRFPGFAEEVFNRW